MEPDGVLDRIGGLVRDARRHRGWTQEQLAGALGSSQSAVNRIERGKQNVSLAMLARIGEVLDSGIVTLGHPGPTHLRVQGGTTLRGSIDVLASKNATVALLCASLLTTGKTPSWCNCDFVSDFSRHIARWWRGEAPLLGSLQTTIATHQVVAGAGYRTRT